MMEPPVEDLLDRVDSKFTLVSLAALRGRQINSYFNQLGEGLGTIVPPQVTSVSRKPLSISLEEIAAGKITYARTDTDGEDEAGEDAASAEPGGAGRIAAAEMPSQPADVEDEGVDAGEPEPFDEPAETVEAVVTTPETELEPGPEDPASEDPGASEATAGLEEPGSGPDAEAASGHGPEAALEAGSGPELSPGPPAAGDPLDQPASNRLDAPPPDEDSPDDDPDGSVGPPDADVDAGDPETADLAGDESGAGESVADPPEAEVDQ
jgi:DNA-directed RNA polymerase subunit omega